MSQVPHPETPEFKFIKKSGDSFTKVSVEIPDLKTRRASLRFKGIRPHVRRAAVNADITFAVAHRTCSLDVTMKSEDDAGRHKKYQLVISDLPHAAKSPPDSYYEIQGSFIILYLRKQK